MRGDVFFPGFLFSEAWLYHLNINKQVYRQTVEFLFTAFLIFKNSSAADLGPFSKACDFLGHGTSIPSSSCVFPLKSSELKNSTEFFQLNPTFATKIVNLEALLTKMPPQKKNSSRLLAIESFIKLYSFNGKKNCQLKSCCCGEVILKRFE